jgi:catechol 2,3-dioxygenase-like lactoylglutathione lyase family enzyme
VRAGTIRDPRGTVAYANGTMSFYPRQCTAERCDRARPLVPSRGQVLDHLGFTVTDLVAWRAWLETAGVKILEPPRAFGDGRAFLIEGPDGLAIELVEVAGAPAVAGRLPT